MVKRTFIAQVFTISDNLKNSVAGIRKNLRGINIKWVEFHNLHLTLSFLGDTTPEQIEQIKNQLENTVKNYHQYTIRLKNAGAFKNLSNPQVLWIGIDADEMLGYLYNDIQQLIEKSGFERDTRPFRPHLTIGRVKNYSPDHNLKEVISAQGPEINDIAVAEAVVFYESNLTPAGPVYTPISTCKLL